MAFISLLIADLMLLGIGVALIGMFGFGVLLILAAIIAKIVRQSKIKKGQSTYSKTMLLSNIAIASGIICLAPLIVLLIRILLI